MDNSHVALVALLMRQDGFEHYRCGALPTRYRLCLSTVTAPHWLPPRVVLAAPVLC